MSVAASIRPVPATRKLGEHVQRELERLILSGQIAVNEQLPTESDLAKSFGVSRTVVREAIHRLEAQGLVRAKVGSGSYVVPFEGGQIVRAMTRYAALNPQREVFLQLLDLRLVIEQETAERLARSRDGEAISKMEQSLSSMRERAGDREAFVSADMDFHMAIAEASGNAFVRVILEPLKSLGQLYGLATYTSAEVIAATIFEHESIVSAIRAGDSLAARMAMRDHITTSRDRYVELLTARQATQSAVSPPHHCRPDMIA